LIRCFRYASFHQPAYYFICLFFLSSAATNNETLTIGNPTSSSTMGEIADVDVYFKRLYSKNTNTPAISVDEFLDIMTLQRFTYTT
jgi:hypothetical protein